MARCQRRVNLNMFVLLLKQLQLPSNFSVDCYLFVQIIYCKYTAGYLAAKY